MNGEHESPRPDPGIGRSLREAREERGLTLRQVEEGTKVRARYLQDLERENFGVLPAVYVLGSLKTYADHLGLDGEALSADLKRRLEPDEPEDSPEEPAKAGSERDTEDEYEAAPLLTVGFDHLFIGMGLVLICGLAAMTLVFSLTTNDGPAVSQIREPAIPEIPSEIALAGNFLERPERQPRSQVTPAEPESKEGDGRNTEEKDENEDPPEQQPEDASSQDSLFDNVKFVPAPSFSPPATGTASPAASASPLLTAPTASAPSSPAPASSASASPAPASAPASAPADPAPADPAPASPAPATDVPADATSTDAPSAATVPASTAPEAASSRAAPAPATAEPAPTATQPVPAAAGASNGPGPQGAQPGELDASSLVDGIDARVNAAVDPVR